MDPEYWGTKKVTELKRELKRKGRSTTGNKTQLIARLCQQEVTVVDDGRHPQERVAVPVDDKECAIRSQYSSLTVKQLKELLKKKPQASLRGKKKDLLDRLVFYELNSDFNVAPSDGIVDLPDPLDAPTLDHFKDIHAQSPLPPFTKQDILLYFAIFAKDLGTAEAMYKDGFLEVVRYCNQGVVTFVYGRCFAEMKKSDRYDVFCKLSADGEVQGATCECTHGRSSGEAHCKHVGVVLLAVVQVKKDGLVTTQLTCTQQLQTFHQPTKKFKGTPLKARQIGRGTKRSLATVQEEEAEILAYRAWVRNVVINGSYNSSMPFKHLLEPANPHAVEADHTYSKCTTADILLDHFHLRKITKDEIERIELETRDQSNSIVWHIMRECRITSSWFYEALHNEDPAAKALSKLYRSKINSRACNHGLKYEKTAIRKYQKKYPNRRVQEDTGLFILESHPFLGDSPDFLIDDDGCGECKCPYTTRHHPVGPKYQPYLIWSKKDPTVMKLKKTHDFYYQVQGHMLCTDRKYCDFVVYTFKDMKDIRIDRKANFISGMLKDLTTFYESYYRPAILRKYLYRDYYKFSFGK